MALIKTAGYSIRGIVACVPKTRFEIKDYPFENESEKKDFITRVGVQSKRIAPAGVTSSDLCINAAKTLIHELNWDPKQIELLVFVTQTPDYLIPFGAATIQYKLGIGNDCIAVNLHEGCSGWVSALSYIYGLMHTYKLKKALLLAGETSYIVSESDKTVFPLIGDAGTATAICAEDNGETSFFNLENFGEDSDAISIRDGGGRHPVTPQSIEPENFGKGISRTRIHSSMNAQKILGLALLQVPKNLTQLLEYAHVKKEEINYLILHQANRILCEGIRKRLGFEPQQTPYSMQQFGNTSSASIPLTIVSGLRDELMQSSNKILVSGFGVGLAIASAILPLPKLQTLSLTEL
jgi:3-oxoacyl-[acyl-carrier-protein] synthase-3